jgi:ABC-type multidrug transport system ATPase subunit
LGDARRVQNSDEPNVSKTFGQGATQVEVLRNLTFTVPEGQFCAIMGPSGSGKSTVLHVAAGLTPLTTGEIAIGWAERSYIDPRLPRLQGFLTTASLVWTATPLTTARFFADTQIVETTLPSVAGILVHTYTFDVDHEPLTPSIDMSLPICRK